MDLREFADRHLGSEEGARVLDVVDRGMKERLQSGLREDHADRLEPLLATIFWQIVLASPEFAQVLERLQIRGSPHLAAEFIVVPHGWEQRPRYDLVLLSHGLRGEESLKLELRDLNLDLMAGFRAWQARRWFELHRLDYHFWPYGHHRRADFYGLISSIGPEFAPGLLREMDFRILAARMPETEFTAVPPSPWAVNVGAAPVADSTAGAVVRDGHNRVGVTASFHAVVGSRASLLSSLSLPIGNRVYVDNQAGTVVDADPVSDSVFVELAQLPGGVTPAVTAGPLIGVSPRQNEKVTFERLNRGTISATVQGWSPDIPFVYPFNQLKVFTNDVTKTGDSGAALLDRSGFILGFSFWRTGINATPAFSAWIWAHSAFDALKLSAF